MNKEPQSADAKTPGSKSGDFPPRVRSPLRKREHSPEAEAATLHPTRSGRSLQNRAPIERKVLDPNERRQERKEAAEIATLKTKLQQQEALQSQWKITQEELASQKLARTSDAARMAEQVASLESQIEIVSANAARAVAIVLKERNVWRAVAAMAGAAALIFLCVVLWPSGHSVNSGSVQTSARLPEVQIPETGIPLPAPGARYALRTLFRDPLPKDPHAALTTAFDRLNRALETIPGRSPEQVLKSLAADGDGCSFVWTNDLPSIVFGMKPAPSNSLAMTLEKCAETVAGLQVSPRP
ncbi:MAG TPA: hypothetical protein VG297_00485 [Bryobacteraceae bacterium]|nr:hypothetical protein [Bryobacteraceae bacterium]